VVDDLLGRNSAPPSARPRLEAGGLDGLVPAAKVVAGGAPARRSRVGIECGCRRRLAVVSEALDVLDDLLVAVPSSMSVACRVTSLDIG